ncbi:hypothetical protein G6F23_016068 [Rhizopus arrhizus]|nr:hypothetical protein G6F23_016068 [Rhizopus arrhizus]
MAHVGDVDHHAAQHREFLQRVAQRAEVAAKLPAVELHRVQRSAAHRRARPVRVIVGRCGARASGRAHV